MSFLHKRIQTFDRPDIVICQSSIPFPAFYGTGWSEILFFIQFILSLPQIREHMYKNSFICEYAKNIKLFNIIWYYKKTLFLYIRNLYFYYQWHRLNKYLIFICINNYFKLYISLIRLMSFIFQHF